MSYLTPEKSKQDKPRGSQAFIVLLPERLALNGYLSYSEPVSLLTYLTHYKHWKYGVPAPLQWKGSTGRGWHHDASKHTSGLAQFAKPRAAAFKLLILLPDMKQIAAFIIWAKGQ